jgi:hypothetical protein
MSWGVCIDDPWTYTGDLAPSSIIIPHLFSIRLPPGPVSLNFGQPTKLGRSDRVLSRMSFFDLSKSRRLRLARIFTLNLARELKRDHIDFVRIWFQWNLFQKKVASGDEQTFRFPLDEFVEIMKSHGIGIIAVIGNGYFRFLPRGLDIDNVEIYVDQLTQATRRIVGHYRGKIAMWQLENEPNWWLQHFGAGWRRGGVWFSPQIVERILGALFEIVRSEDSNALTMVNLQADSLKNSLSSFAKYSDVLGLDFYPNYVRATPVDGVDLMARVSRAKRETGKPIVIAETGYPSGPKLFGFNSYNQTEYVRKVCEASVSSDMLSGLGLWRLSDTYWLSFPYQENSFGLLNRQGIPKPAWQEFTNFTRNR